MHDKKKQINYKNDKLIQVTVFLCQYTRIECELPVIQLEIIFILGVCVMESQ